MSGTIYCNGIPVPRVDDSKHFFHNRLTCIFGGSGTGKSALTQHILNTLKDVIPNIVVACPTAAMNGDYTNIVPDQCIFDDITKPLVQKIFQRQENVVLMHEMVHNHRHISKLFDKIATETLRYKVAKLKDIYQKGRMAIANDPTKDENDSDELKKKYHNKLVRIMRNGINGNIGKLNQVPLTEMEQALVSNFNINPSLLLIADDCMASINEWGKLEETKKLFYQGRHYRITSIILVQAVSSLPPLFRGNAHISIFTTENGANDYINKASSGFSSEDKKRMSRIAGHVFAPSNEKAKPNYKKLVIFGSIIDTKDKVQYIIGSPRKKKFGGAALWAVCQELRQSGSRTISNSFSKTFNLRLTDGQHH